MLEKVEWLAMELGFMNPTLRKMAHNVLKLAHVCLRVVGLSVTVNTQDANMSQEKVVQIMVLSVVKSQGQQNVQIVLHEFEMTMH